MATSKKYDSLSFSKFTFETLSIGGTGVSNQGGGGASGQSGSSQSQSQYSINFGVQQPNVADFLHNFKK